MAIILKLNSLEIMFPNWKRPMTRSGIQKSIIYVTIRTVGVGNLSWSLMFGWAL